MTGAAAGGRSGARGRRLVLFNVFRGFGSARVLGWLRSELRWSQRRAVGGSRCIRGSCGGGGGAGTFAKAAAKALVVAPRGLAAAARHGSVVCY